MTNDITSRTLQNNKQSFAGKIIESLIKEEMIDKITIERLRKFGLKSQSFTRNESKIKSAIE